MSGQLTLSAPFRRDDGRDAAILQPLEQAPQLGAQHGAIAKSREQRLQRIENHPLRADLVDGIGKTDEQPFEIVLAALRDLAPLDPDVVDQQLLLADERGQIVAERTHIGRQILGALFEAHDYARFIEACGAIHQERQGEERLPTACGAGDQRRTARRKPAERNFVQTCNARRRLAQLFGHAGRPVLHF